MVAVVVGTRVSVAIGTGVSVGIGGVGEGAVVGTRAAGLAQALKTSMTIVVKNNRIFLFMASPKNYV